MGKEAYGSRWPKVTLGCLDDGADLTRPEFEALRALCHRHRLDRPTALRLDGPRCVLYANRALEKLLLSTPLPAAAARAADAGPEPPAPESAAMVEEILAEMDGGDYWHSYIRGDGGVRPNRASHYRGLANGTTVVQFLGSKANAAAGGQLLQRIAEFRKAVDDALPGKYCWFQDGKRGRKQSGDPCPAPATLTERHADRCTPRDHPRLLSVKEGEESERLSAPQRASSNAAFHFSLRCKPQKNQPAPC